MRWEQDTDRRRVRKAGRLGRERVKEGGFFWKKEAALQRRFCEGV